MVDKKQVMEVLKRCYDPEMPVNIVDLGLIYGVSVDKGKVNVKMTLTSPGCPMHFFMAEDIKKNVSDIKGVKDVDVEVVFNPPWTLEMMSKSARKTLGL